MLILCKYTFYISHCNGLRGEICEQALMILKVKPVSDGDGRHGQI